MLVGTASVEASEMVSRMLKLQKITHNVLNAKYHRQEAEIVARAGLKGTVTISTNMAGRGTDIKLGGNPEMQIEQETETLEGVAKQSKIDQLTAEVERAKQDVLAAGGLFVIGTERHEAERIDRQLAGRAGRQGDPGTAQFFIALDDGILEGLGIRRDMGAIAMFGGLA